LFVFVTLPFDIFNDHSWAVIVPDALFASEW